MKTAKTNRFWRTAGHAARGFGLLSLLLLVILYGLLDTRMGLRLIRDGIQHFGGQTLQISSVKGYLLGDFQLDGLRYNHDGTHLRLGSLHVEWRPGALWHGLLHLRRVTLVQLRLTLPAASKSAPSTAEGFKLPRRLPVDLRIDALKLGGLTLKQPGSKPFVLGPTRFKGRWVGDVLNINELQGRFATTGPLMLHATAVSTKHALRIVYLQLQGPGTVHLLGTLGYGATPGRLRLRWSRLRWPLTGRAKPIVTALRGHAQLAGTLSRYRIELHAEGRSTHGPLRLRAAGNGDTEHIKLARFSLDTRDAGSVSASGTLRWAPRLHADFDLRLRHLNPALLMTAYAGDLNGVLHLHTRSSHALRFEAALKHSTLRGKPLSLTARGEMLPKPGRSRLELRQLAVNWGGATLDAHGEVLPPFDLQGHLSSPDLALLNPGLGGRLKADFRLTGTQARPHLISKGEGIDLRRGAQGVKRIAWDADLDPLKPSRLRIRIEQAQLGQAKTGSVAHPLVVSQATLQATGVEQYQHIALHAVTSEGTLALRLTGGYNRKREEWGGQVVALKLVPTGLPSWQLQNSPGLLLGSRRLSLESTCLAGTSGKLCLQLQRAVKKPGLQLSWTLQAIQLASFKALFPERLQVTGQLDGRGQLYWAGGNVDTLQSKIVLKNGELQIPDAPVLHLEPSVLKLTEQQQIVHAVVDLKARQGRIQADVSAAAARRFTQRQLSGTVSMTVPELAFVQPFIPGTSALHGSVEGRFRLGGSIEKPRVAGKVAMRDGSIGLAVPGITLRKVNVALIAPDSGPMQVQASIRSGGGTLTVNGQVEQDVRPIRVKLTAQGKDFQVMDTADARVWVTPKLSLLRDRQGIHVSGQLVVPKAEITPRSGLSEDEGVTVSSDQRIVGQKPQPASSPDVFAKLALVLGKDVRFKGYGLTTRIVGRVELDQQPQQPALAQGELSLEDGRYKAYGQDLKIESGHLIFNGGPVTQPGINILAVRKPREDIQVGVHVRGTLDKPEVSLTSNPAMPREQQLSWLLFGQPLEQNSSSQQNAVASAALTLGLAGGGYIANRIGKKLGLDTVTLGTPSGGGSAVAADPYAITGSQASQGEVGANGIYGNQAAQLTLGKYLTPRLYISYGISLFEPGQTFRLLYDIGHGFKLQTESGIANGGDLIYSFEGGK